MHAYRKKLLENICQKLEEHKMKCNFTMKDHALIKEDLKKENNGEFTKKKFLSMLHLVVYHKRT